MKYFFNSIILFLAIITVSEASEIDSLKDVLRSGKSSLHKIDALNRLSVLQLAAGQPEEAYEQAKKAMSASRHFKYLTGKAGALENFALIHLYRGQYDSAMIYFKNALQYGGEKLGCGINARIQLKMGDICYARADYKSSFGHYVESLENFSKCDDTLGCAEANICLAKTFTAGEHFAEARVCLEKTERFIAGIKKQKAYKQLALRTQLEKARLYMAQKQYAQASPLIKNVLENTIKDTQTQLFATLTLGEYYLAEDRAQLALANLKSVGDIYCSQDGEGYQYGCALAQLRIAQAQMLQSKYLLVVRGLSQAIKLTDSLKFEGILQQMHWVAALANEKTGAYPEALASMVAYTDLQKALKQTNSEKQMNINYQKLEVYRKDAEAQRLEALNQINERQITNSRLYVAGTIIVGSMLVLVLIAVAGLYKHKLNTSKALMAASEGINLENSLLFTQNNRLKESEARLNLLNSTKDKFFSIISHDLKSPINSLIGLLRLLQSYMDAFSRQELDDFAKNIKKSVLALNSLLNNLVHWSEAQTGAVPFVPDSINIYDIVENNIALSSAAAENKNITLFNGFSKDTYCFADPNMVDFVIRNLLSNAIKFTRRSGNVCFMSEKTGMFTSVTVTDSGVGMNQADMDKLFRLDAFHSTKGTSQEEGTGLGLLLCQEFIKKCGGEISVKSKIGEWTSFTFTLPSLKTNSDDV